MNSVSSMHLAGNWLLAAILLSCSWRLATSRLNTYVSTGSMSVYSIFALASIWVASIYFIMEPFANEKLSVLGIAAYAIGSVLIIAGTVRMVYVLDQVDEVDPLPWKRAIRSLSAPYIPGAALVAVAAF